MAQRRFDGLADAYIVDYLASATVRLMSVAMASPTSSLVELSHVDASTSTYSWWVAAWIGMP